MGLIKRTLLLLILAVVIPASASAQQLRIGYVDMKRVLDNAPQVLAGREKLDQEFRPRNDAIVADEERAEGLEQRLALGDLTPDAGARLERELRELRRSINRQREDLRDELSFRRTEEVQRLEDQINLAVQEIAERNGYDLILSSPVVYADQALDITDLILQQLQIEFEADQREICCPESQGRLNTTMARMEKANEKRLTLEELANRFDLALRGDGRQEIGGVGTLASAGPEDVTFLANAVYRKLLSTTRAGAVILHEDEADNCPVNCLIAADPYVSYARIAGVFDSRPHHPPGIHPSAVIEAGADIGKEVYIGPHTVIGKRSVIGEGCSIGPGCVVGPDATLGNGCRLIANVTVMDGVHIGRRVVLHAGAVVGADGFGIAMAKGRWEKVPQLGGVTIGDDCEIGANTAIDRGAIDDTVLEEDVRIDNHVQVGHNVFIGAHTAIAGCSGIAGSARIGRYCLLAGGSGISGHLEIADRVTITANTMVTKSIDTPGSTWASGVPARPLRAWLRSMAQLDRLGQRSRRPRTGADGGKENSEP